MTKRRVVVEVHEDDGTVYRINVEPASDEIVDNLVKQANTVDINVAVPDGLDIEKLAQLVSREMLFGPA